MWWLDITGRDEFPILSIHLDGNVGTTAFHVRDQAVRRLARLKRKTVTETILSR